METILIVCFDFIVFVRDPFFSLLSSHRVVEINDYAGVLVEMVVGTHARCHADTQTVVLISAKRSHAEAAAKTYMIIIILGFERPHVCR